MENFEARLQARLIELAADEKQLVEKVQECDKQINIWSQNKAVHVGNLQQIMGGKAEIETMLALAQEPPAPEAAQE